MSGETGCLLRNILYIEVEQNKRKLGMAGNSEQSVRQVTEGQLLTMARDNAGANAISTFSASLSYTCVYFSRKSPVKLRPEKAISVLRGLVWSSDERSYAGFLPANGSRA